MLFINVSQETIANIKGKRREGKGGEREATARVCGRLKLQERPGRKLLMLVGPLRDTLKKEGLTDDDSN